MKHCLLLSTLLIISVLPVSTRAEESPSQRVTFREKQAGQLEVVIGDKVFGVYNSGKNWGKPFLYPVHAPNGKNVLREIVPTKADQGSSKDGTDHFHHKGVWIAVDSVNEEQFNFWHEDDRIVCNKVEHATNDDGSATLTIHNTWMGGENPLLKETTTATFHPSRLAVYKIQLAAIDKDVTFHDTKEGFFAVRVAHTMREMQGGHMVNAEGEKGEKNCWGKPTPWIDYVGDVEGQTCGVTLMDHPDNFRESRYHARAYGLFAISPFGPKKYSNGKEDAAPVTISPGKKSLNLTYGLFVHDGDTAAGRVAEHYQTFLKVSQ